MTLPTNFAKSVTTVWVNRVAGTTPQTEDRQQPSQETISPSNEVPIDSVDDDNIEQCLDFSDIDTGLPGYEIKTGKKRIIISEDPVGYASVASPTGRRSSTKSDAPSEKPYIIYIFNVYDYKTKDEFLKARSTHILTAPINQFELTFDQLLNKGHNDILESTEQLKEIRFLTKHKDKLRSAKYCLQLTDLGGAMEVMNDKNKAQTSVYHFTGGGAKHNPRIKIHPGGPKKSAQCATSPLISFFQTGGNTKKIQNGEKQGHKKAIAYYEATDNLLDFEEYFRARLRIDDSHTKSLIILPGKSIKYSK